MAQLFSAHTIRPDISAGATLGYVMQHRTGSDRGFAWQADDARFSEDWERIPVGLVPPAPERLSPDVLAQMIADTAEHQGIEPEAVEAFQSLLVAVARGAEDRLLTQLGSRPAPASDADKPSATVDDSTFAGLLASLLYAAERSTAKNSSLIYMEARERFVRHIDSWGRKCALYPSILDTPVIDPVAAELIRAGLPLDEVLRVVASVRAQQRTKQRSDEAEVMLDALENRLERIYASCCSTAPKQALGELIDGMMQMPEWSAIRSLVTTGSA